MNRPLPKIIADTPLSKVVLDLLEDRVEILPWSHLLEGIDPSVEGIYTFGHPKLDGVLMDRVPNVKVISNHGVGVDHIHLEDARARGIPVGNTPGVLDGATADMGFCLLMAAGRRLAEGIKMIESGEFFPSRLIGREIHGSSLGIIGMGRIGVQVARRAAGFDMNVSYFNRNRRIDIEEQLSITYKSLKDLLATSDFVMLCVPLTPETRGLIGAEELRMMKSTATLINLARGGVVDTDALTVAMTENWIYAAALDVTEPEPLPPNHPLLALSNVTIAPHLGSATAETRQKMAELSIENLMAGLQGNRLLHAC